MTAENTTNKIKFDISEIKAGITESNRLIKLANAQFKAAASGMDDWQNSADGLEAKIEQLNTVHTEETKKLEGLKKQYELVVEAEGENSASAIKLATQINNQQAAINRVAREMSTYEERLDTVKQASSEAERTGRDFKDVLAEIDKAASNAGGGIDEATEGFTVLKGALADLAAGAVEWVIGGVKDLTSAIMELPEATKEFRTTFAAVEQSAKDSVIGIDGARKAYEEFFKIAADEGQSAEATSHIAQLVSSEEDLQKAVDGVMGAWIRWGDSISIEGLAEAASESANTGKITGQLADAINWAGQSEEEFQKKLDECTTTQERQNLIVDMLNSTYGENTKAYKDNNASLVDANAANLRMLETQSELAEVIEPLTAAWTNLKAKGIEAITPAIEFASTKLQELMTYLKEHETTAAVLGAVIGGLAAAFGILAGALLISNLISAVQKAFALLNVTMLANPVVLIVAAIAGLVVAFVALWNKSESFRAFWINLWESVKNVLGIAKDFIVNAFNAIMNFFTVTIPNAFNSTISFFQNNWQTILLLILNPFAGVIKLLWDKSKSFQKIVNSIVSYFKKLPSKIWNAISSAPGKIVTWGNNMKAKAVAAGAKVVSGVIGKIEEIPGKIVSIGGNIVEGLWNGINDKVGWIKSKLVQFKDSVMNALKDFFGIHSPSKVMRDMIGRFLPEGIAVGVQDYAYKAVDAVKNLGGQIMGAVDMEGLGVPQMGGALATAGGGGTVNNYVFNQTNNSPTALSRIDIYRQTKQQLKQLKRVR